MDKKILLLVVILVITVGLFVQLAFAAKGGRGPKPKPECKDRIDNDGDGNIDWPADSGCANKNDNDESDCGDGVCEGEETPGNCPADCGEFDSCNDTDGGNVITIFGTTSGYYNGDSYSNDDYCVDSGNIMEYYCSGDYEQSQQQSCGDDGYVGDNYCFNNSVYRDWRDYYCSSGECDYTDTPTLIEYCVYGCTAGECNPIPDSCSDTDGGIVITIQGTVSGHLNEQPYGYTDFCAGNTTVIEYYCLGDYSYNTNSSCITNTTSYCSNGACS